MRAEASITREGRAGGCERGSPGRRDRRGEDHRPAGTRRALEGDPARTGQAESRGSSRRDVEAGVTSTQYPVPRIFEFQVSSVPARSNDKRKLMFRFTL